MIIAAVLSAIISTISPFWGLFFILSYGVKHHSKNAFWVVFAATIAALRFIDPKIIPLPVFSDIILGVGLTAFLFFTFLFRTKSYEKTILAVSMYNFLYGIIRFAVFKNFLLKTISNVFEQYNVIFEEMAAGKNEYLMIFQDSVDQTQAFFTDFYPAIWGSGIIIALWLGSLMVSKKNEIKWSHKVFRMPYFIVYFLLAALLLSIYTKTRIYGFNGLIMIAPLFLIQGISILDFYWGKFFKKSKFLLVLLVISIIINIPIIILIMLMGVADVWLNFRKIYVMEEIDENHLS